MEHRDAGVDAAFEERPAPQEQRRHANHCGVCNAGYGLSGSSCVAFAGSCSNGNLKALQKRSQVATLAASQSDTLHAKDFALSSAELTPRETHHEAASNWVQ